MRIAAIAIVCIAVSGCTYAGPFVTNISSDGQGNLLIEKSMVEHNSFVGSITTTPHSTTLVKFGGGSELLFRAPEKPEPKRPHHLDEED